MQSCSIGRKSSVHPGWRCVPSYVEGSRRPARIQARTRQLTVKSAFHRLALDFLKELILGGQPAGRFPLEFLIKPLRSGSRPVRRCPVQTVLRRTGCGVTVHDTVTCVTTNVTLATRSRSIQHEKHRSYVRCI